MGRSDGQFLAQHAAAIYARWCRLHHNVRSPGKSLRKDPRDLPMAAVAAAALSSTESPMLRLDLAGRISQSNYMLLQLDFRRGILAPAAHGQ